MKFEIPDQSKTTRPQDYLIFGYEQAQDYFYYIVQEKLRKNPKLLHESYEELHFLVFSADGNFFKSELEAEHWMGTNALRCLRYVIEMEMYHMGENFSTPFSAMDVANAYMYWLGDLVVQNYYKACDYESSDEQHIDLAEATNQYSSTH